MEGGASSSIKSVYHAQSALFCKLFVLLLVVLLTISSSGAYTDDRTEKGSSFDSTGPPLGEGSNSTVGDNISCVICTWKDNKSAAISLTFDDGLASQVDLAVPLMNERGFNGTFFIIIKHVNQYDPTRAEWCEWNNVSLMGHEVASHTLNHPDLTTVDPQTLWEEVVLSKRYIQENISTAPCETFCYPYTNYNDTVVDLVKQHYIGARAGDWPSTPVNSSPDLYTVDNANFGESETVAEMNQLVEDAVDMKGWLVEMIHAIEGDGWDPVPLENLTAHLDYLVDREDAIWVAPFVNVVKYIRERDDTDVVVTLLSDYSFTLFLNSSLDPVIYNENLTLNITLPLDWTEIQVRKGNESQTITPWIAGENRYFLFDSPINETVTVSRTAPVLSFIEAAPGSNSSFFPESGDSNTVFTFKVNYSSPLNLGPNPGVECVLDLNGDGDTLDVFGSMSEGPYLMEKLNATDTDYTDGCLYQFNTLFPFASSPWFAFSAEDIEGRSACDPDNLTTMRPGPYIANFTILKEGWNLISIPYIQPDTNLSSILKPIEGSWDTIWWYNSSDNRDQWKLNNTSKPSNMNDLDDVNHTMGFWIYIIEPGGILFPYLGIQPNENQTISLCSGWNLVGYPSLIKKNRTEALNNIDFGNDVDSIWTYNTTTSQWDEIGPSDCFEVGRGYWIHSKVAKTWIVPS